MTTSPRRLIYARAGELDRWHCRALENIPIVDLRDRQAGRLDGIVLDAHDKRALYIGVAGKHRFLVPVGDGWFDETARVIRIDAVASERIAFDPDEFDRMTPEQADAYERRLLAECCPEIGFHRDGRPDYGRLSQFTCRGWSVEAAR